MVTINKYIKALWHLAGGHQGSHKAHQAGNQSVMSQYHNRQTHYKQVMGRW